MKWLPLTLLACLPICVAAQPVLQASAHTPYPGDSLIRSIAYLNTFTPPPAGAGVTFDHSQLPAPLHHVRTPFQPNAPAANEVGFTYLIIISIYGSLYQYTPDSLTRRADGYPAPEMDQFFREDPSLRLPFPCQFGDRIRDTYAGTRMQFFVNTPFSGHAWVHADAWGTLILPGDTIPNVMRVVTTDTMALGIPANMVYETTYHYYTPTRVLPVLTIGKRTLDQEWSVFQDSLIRGPGLAADALKGDALSTYPNPIGGRLSLVVDAPGMLHVSDMTGRVMLATDLEPGTHAFDTQSWPSGALVLRWTGAGGQVTRKLLKR